jgi:hypothetical protein
MFLLVGGGGGTGPGVADYPGPGGAWERPRPGPPTMFRWPRCLSHRQMPSLVVLYLSGRSNNRYHLDHRYRTNWSRTGFSGFVRCRWSRRKFLPAEGRQKLVPGPPVSHITDRVRNARNRSGIDWHRFVPLCVLLDFILRCTRSAPLRTLGGPENKLLENCKNTYVGR